MVIGNKTGIGATDAKAASLLSQNDVPAKNSTDNVHIRDVAGNKTDDEGGDSLYSKAHIQDMHTHAPMWVYPSMADGVLITGALAAWTLGNFAVIIPANTKASIFDIHQIEVEAYNANDLFEIVLYAGADGAEVEIARKRIKRLTNVGASPSVFIQTPRLPANTQIKAKVATQNGTLNTITISVAGHDY